MATEEQAIDCYGTFRRQYPKLPAWEEMDDDMRKPWYEAADKKREREARIKIAIDRLEPEIIDASEPSIQMSIAISLKRIADSLEER